MKLLVTVLSVLLLLACNSTIPEPEPKPIELTLKGKALVESDNEFGLEMFRLINADEEDNFTISPLSVSLALAMTYNGARGETKAAMEEALKLTGFATDEINQLYQTLVKELLAADNKVTIEIAQSIWYRNNFNVLDEFKEVNRQYYDAEVAALDFARPDALEIINGWIADKTHDKIQDMIQEIRPDHVMFLINAIYFNGTWKSEFKKSDTRKQDFFIDEQNSIKVDMMHKTDTVRYQQNELFAAVELPYGRGNFNMIVLLPNQTSQFDEMLDQLNAENWKNMLSSFSQAQTVSIWLPKFKNEYEIKLNDVLSAMGMEIAFDARADFSGINGYGDIYIDYVQHNTFIEVDEKGTEAAAATVVAMVEYAAAMPTVFNANRPFVYAITEKETGAILFMGKIVKPEYN